MDGTVFYCRVWNLISRLMKLSVLEVANVSTQLGQQVSIQNEWPRMHEMLFKCASPTTSDAIGPNYKKFVDYLALGAARVEGEGMPSRDFTKVQVQEAVGEV